MGFFLFYSKALFLLTKIVKKLSADIQNLPPTPLLPVFSSREYYTS